MFPTICYCCLLIIEVECFTTYLVVIYISFYEVKIFCAQGLLKNPDIASEKSQPRDRMLLSVFRTLSLVVGGPLVIFGSNIGTVGALIIQFRFSIACVCSASGFLVVFF